MSDGSVRAELKRLAHELLLTDAAKCPAHTQEWVKRMAEKYGEAEAEWAYDVVQIQRAQIQTVHNYHTENGDIGVSHNSINAGGSVIASAAGDGNMIQAGDISLYNQQVDQAQMKPV